MPAQTKFTLHGAISYHIFYQICTGMPIEEHKEHLAILDDIGPAKSFSYLNASSCFEIERVDDVRFFLICVNGSCLTVAVADFDLC
eukprot:SAG31_NODE_23648_length_499_cov_1.220000_1_plen_86_part_00